MHLKCDTAGEAANTLPGCIYRRTSWRRRVMVPCLHDPSDTESEILCIALGIVISERCGHAGKNVKKCGFYWAKTVIMPH